MSEPARPRGEDPTLPGPAGPSPAEGASSSPRSSSSSGAASLPPAPTGRFASLSKLRGAAIAPEAMNGGPVDEALVEYLNDLIHRLREALPSEYTLLVASARRWPRMELGESPGKSRASRGLAADFELVHRGSNIAPTLAGRLQWEAAQRLHGAAIKAAEAVLAGEKLAEDFNRYDFELAQRAGATQPHFHIAI